MGSPNKLHPATFTTTGRTWICPSAIALQSLFRGTWLTSTEGHGTASIARFTVERLAGLAVLDPGAKLAARIFWATWAGHWSGWVWFLLADLNTTISSAAGRAKLGDEQPAG
jgi:hypothetical protein